jgi:hypothetical protein
MLTRRGAASLGFAVLALAGSVACSPEPGGHGPGNRGLRIDEIQVVGTHNSYHVQAEPTLFDALRSFLGAGADGLEYTHRPLADELDAGVRQLELDVFRDDPAGGRYATPKLGPVLGLAPTDPALAQPGLKVFHIQEVDYRSTCPTFVDCLTQVKEWSDANPRHLPITIQVEAKDGSVPDPGFGFVTAVPWTSDGFTELETEIRSVFRRHDVITPREVRGRHDSVADAARAGRWPTVQSARGRVMFVLDAGGAKRQAYRDLHPDPDDRLIFVSAAPPEPDAGVVVVNDPVADGDRIRGLVAEGFIVRTRADADTLQARSGDVTMRDAAFASGAQYVSTDYPFPDELFGTGYVVRVPGGGPARCNPVSAPPSCDSATLRG